MAHLRARHILDPFEQMLKFSRITGVIGHRQTGKSTFVEAHSNEYFTLDDKRTLEKAKNDPHGFIDSLKAKKSAIDECQLLPDLFPALKLKIGTSLILLIQSLKNWVSKKNTGIQISASLASLLKESLES